MSSFAGTAVLVRLALRRDRVRLPVWVLSLGVMMVYATQALNALYPTAADRQVRALLISSPAAVMMSGPGYGVDDYTLGAMIANEFALTLVIASSIMSIFLVVRHTRAEEESGRSELVRAGVTGLHAQLTAALVVAVLANLAVAVVQLAALLAAGLTPIDSAALALAMASVSLVFAALTAVCVQVAASARAATGAALALLAVAFVIRALGDTLERGGSTLSWFSPIAWMHQMRPFVDLRWWPDLLTPAAAAIAVAAACLLLPRRDVAAGFLQPRPGRREASTGMSGPLGLAWRLQHGMVVAWAVGLGLMFAASGSLLQTVADSMTEMPPAVVRVLGIGADDLVNGFASVMATLAALAVGAYAVASVLRLRGEEQAGRTAQALAAAVGRGRWLAAGVGLAALTSTGLLAVAGLALGSTAAVVTSDGGWVLRLTTACLAYAPAVWLVAGVTAALYGFRASTAGAAWLLVVYAVVVGLFGSLLDLPAWALNLSPVHLTPRLPAEEFAVSPLLLLALVGLLLGLAGAFLFRRRDLTA